MSTRASWRVALLTSLLSCVPASALASDGCLQRVDRLGWYVPDYAKLQTGGYLGVVTVGAGYTAFDLLDLDLYYGFVPAAVGGVDVHTPAARVGLHVKGVCLTPTLRWKYLHGGVGMLFGFGDGFFLSPPPRPARSRATAHSWS